MERAPSPAASDFEVAQASRFSNVGCRTRSRVCASALTDTWQLRSVFSQAEATLLRFIFTQLQLGDQGAMHFIGAVGDAQGADRGKHFG